MKRKFVLVAILILTVVLVAWDQSGSFAARDEVRAFNMKDIKSNNVEFIIAKKTGVFNVTAQGNNEAPDMPCWPANCPGKDTCMDCVVTAVKFTRNSRDAFSHLTAIPEKALPKLTMQVVSEANGMIFNTLVTNETLTDVIFTFRPTMTGIANSTFKYVLNGQTIGFGHKLNKR